MNSLEIRTLFEDEWYTGVDKPENLLVHKTSISEDKVFLLQILRDLKGKKVYPVHRLDRPTSGVILFAYSTDSLRSLNKAFREGEVSKSYLLVVRGYVNESGVLDYPLQNPDTLKYQDAITRYNPLKTVEIPIATGRYSTSRYTLVEAFPETGRRHQIRKHFAHLRHPIIGDVKYGDGKHNRVFRNHFEVNRLMLMSSEIGFVHPYTDENIKIKASPSGDFKRLVNTLFGIWYP